MTFEEPTPPKKKKKGTSGSSLILLCMALGAGYTWFGHLKQPFPELAQWQRLWAEGQTLIQPLIEKINPPEESITPPPIAQETSELSPASEPSPAIAPKPSPVANSPKPVATPVASQTSTATAPPKATSPWEKKEIRGIYLSRYQVTNNASEAKIRERVRFYKSQGFNTIIHGVFGNGCPMYRSQVMFKTFGMGSCPNLFRDQWLDWLIDEAHLQGMQVHAYFEKGIKLDKNSPIYDLAVREKWLVPGVDKTYTFIDHYVLDVKVPQVSQFFKAIAVEFVQRYPKIDAVQWDDYVGYHAELSPEGTESSGKKVDRTPALTAFMQTLVKGVKQANPKVSFDVCHHNPYWAKRYFAADWANWNVDRAFIQVYNDQNFDAEMDYVHQYDGAAIMDNQLHRLKPLIADNNVKSILIFPAAGKPEESAQKVQNAVTKLQP